MGNRAIIPVVFYWDSGTPACTAWDDTPARRANHAAHKAGAPHSLSHGGPSPRVRYWLSERRRRWFHDAQVRG